MIPHMAFTEPWNATGQPAVSLPLGVASDGLPVGVQLVAPPGREDLLVAVAAQLFDRVERPTRRPPIHA
jgi:amidase